MTDQVSRATLPRLNEPAPSAEDGGRCGRRPGEGYDTVHWYFSKKKLT